MTPLGVTAQAVPGRRGPCTIPVPTTHTTHPALHAPTGYTTAPVHHRAGLQCNECTWLVSGSGSPGFFFITLNVVSDQLDGPACRFDLAVKSRALLAVLSTVLPVPERVFGTRFAA